MAPKTALLEKPFLDPSNTLILVTGASGYIASNIIKEALDLGYHVRGTARTQEKCERTVQEQKNHPNYTTALVPDLAVASAELDAAVKGVDSILHVATDTTFTSDADGIIASVVAQTENVLRAAAAEPRVRRFTLTSSSTAATFPRPGEAGVVVTADTWNDETVHAARHRKGESMGPNSYPFVVYGASKTEGERALWRFVERERPAFVANSVLPNFNTGRIIGSVSLTGQLPIGILREGVESASWVLSQYYIDVVDDARLHLCAAVLDESLENQRIFGYASPFTVGDVAEVIKKLRPDADHSKLQYEPNEPRDLSKVPNELGAELLKKWYGQDGYKSLEESLKENLEGI